MNYLIHISQARRPAFIFISLKEKIYIYMGHLLIIKKSDRNFDQKINIKLLKTYKEVILK